MHSPSAEFDLNSLAEKGLQQKLLEIEREYQEKYPIIETAIHNSKKIIDISTQKSVPDTKAILEKIIEVHKTILSIHKNKIKEISSILVTINLEIETCHAEIVQIEIAIDELDKIEKGTAVIDPSDMLALQSALKEMEDGNSTAKSAELTPRDFIEYMKHLESESRKNLEILEENKKKTIDRLNNWNTFTEELIRKLDKMKAEHLKNSYSMITDTIKTGKENMKRGEQCLKNLERRYHAVLKYRRLCYFESDTLSYNSAPTLKR